MIDFLIIYERKYRELESAIYMKRVLESKGFTCEVVQFYDASEYKLFGGSVARVMIVPHLYSMESVARNFSRFGRADHVVNLQYEQVLSEKWHNLGSHDPVGEARKGHHVCWGVETVERLIRVGVHEDNVLNFQPLHFDLLYSMNRKQDSIRGVLARDFDLPLDKEWVLFMSSFTYADISKSRLEINEVAAGCSLKDFPRIHTDSRNAILSWFRKFLNESNDILIYRPHPDELSMDSVHQLESEFDNFKVIRDRSVKFWIAASNSLLTWYSTSIAEAHFLGRSYAILRPKPLPDDFDSVLLKKGSFISSEKEFVDLYQSSGAVSGQALESRDVERYYGEAPNSYSANGLFEVVGDLLDKPRTQFKLPFRSLLVAKLKSLLVALVYFWEKRMTRVCSITNLHPIVNEISSEMRNQIVNREDYEALRKEITDVMSES